MYKPNIFSGPKSVLSSLERFHCTYLYQLLQSVRVNQPWIQTVCSTSQIPSLSQVTHAQFVPVNNNSGMRITIYDLSNPWSQYLLNKGQLVCCVCVSGLFVVLLWLCFVFFAFLFFVFFVCVCLSFCCLLFFCVGSLCVCVFVSLRFCVCACYFCFYYLLVLLYLSKENGNHMKQVLSSDQWALF